MKIVVALKNIVKPCGDNGLAKDRMAIMLNGKSWGKHPLVKKSQDEKQIILNVEENEMDEYFRDATEKEVEAFNSGIKYVTEISA